MASKPRVLRQAAIRAVCFPTVAMKDSGPDHRLCDFVCRGSDPPSQRAMSCCVSWEYLGQELVYGMYIPRGIY
jgi:hypothetical protein